MKFIKHQVTACTCQYIAHDFEGSEPCMALYVDISSYGFHEVRLGAYFGQHDDEVAIERVEFICAFEKAEFGFHTFHPALNLNRPER